MCFPPRRTRFACRKQTPRDVFSCSAELTATTWRTSSPSSSWGPSTPWRVRPWGRRASTSWRSRRPACCIAWLTWRRCRRPPARWPIWRRRCPACPWRCRSWRRSPATRRRRVSDFLIGSLVKGEGDAFPNCLATSRSFAVSDPQNLGVVFLLVYFARNRKKSHFSSTSETI